jgi:hypothetical protein
MQQIIVRHSNLKDMRQCPLKHRIGWIEGWRKDSSDASDIGTDWHAIMAVHYLALQALQQTTGKLRRTNAETQSVFDAVEATIDSISPKNQDLIWWMYDGYLDQHGFDEAWEILHAEETRQCHLGYSLDREIEFLYQWTSDVVVRDHEMRKAMLVVDNKSTAQPLRQVDVDLDDQFGMYAWAWSGKYGEVVIPVCNQAKTKQLKRAQTLAERFARIKSTRSAFELSEIQLDFLRTARAAYGPDNLAGPYSAPDPRICGWKCDFKEAHLYLRKTPGGFEKLGPFMKSRGFHQGEAPNGSA